MFEFAEFSIVFWNPGEHSPNAEFLLFGGYWSVFWILHLLLGALVPLLLFLRASRAGWIVGSVLALIGFAAARMCVLIPGQIAGQIPGLAEAFQDVRLTYTYQATTTEYLVGCFMVSVGMAILYVGMRLSRTLESATAQET